MIAEIVSVGTELLLGQIVDTHAPTMARILADCGIGCVRRSTIGDNLERLVEELRAGLARADVVITIGGLGPTADDLTRDAIAIALGDRLIRIPEREEKLRRFFELRKLTWLESIARQADRPESAEFVDNPYGSAPGLICRKSGKTVIALPGPKSEFDPMANGAVRALLSALGGGEVIHSRVVRISGMGESHVEERVRHLMDGDNPTVAPYAHPGEVHLRLTARAISIEAADGLINPVEHEIRRLLGHAVFGVDGTTLEAALIAEGASAGLTIATAESMTGGAVAERLSSVPGASATFLGGVTTYTVAAKSTLLGIDCGLIERFGPVSREVATAMAERVRDRLSADLSVAVTGNAGPTSDVDGKPVGLVFIAIASHTGVEVEEARCRGSRDEIRRRATQLALTRLRKAIIGSSSKA